jgi:hypothetical protein
MFFLVASRRGLEWNTGLMARHTEELVLRQRSCVNPACNAIFTICVSCDRGQRYCSQTCRMVNRRRQRSAANRRYQQSERGRVCHRQCQRRYRTEQKTEAVTDQGSQSIISPAIPARPLACACSVCGKRGRWINPYPLVPGRRKPARSSDFYVFW